MGNICSGGEEKKKASAFQSPEDSDQLQVPDKGSSIPDSASAQDGGFLDAGAGGSNGMSPSIVDATTSAATQQAQKINEAELKAQREEQNRLELIVQMAGRGMVSVRSTRGSTGYYDQGFAAALGQHLEQTTKFPDTLPIRLPPVTKRKDSNVLARLSQPQWENIALGKKGVGTAGCDGENPNTYMDHVAVSFLDSAVPKKERIFHGGVGPMVENLL